MSLPDTQPRASRPLDPGLFTWPSDDPRLTASSCRVCGWLAFPTREMCGRCAADDVVTVELPDRGTVWSLTTQEFPLKAPYRGSAETFVLGYVDLGELIVESVIDVEPEAVHTGRVDVGTAVRLAIVDFDGDHLSYCFRPEDEAAGPGAPAGAERGVSA